MENSAKYQAATVKAHNRKQKSWLTCGTSPEIRSTENRKGTSSISCVVFIKTGCDGVRSHTSSLFRVDI